MTFSKRPSGQYDLRVKGKDGKWCKIPTGLTNREEAEKWAKDNNIEEMERLAVLGLLTQRTVSTLLVGKQKTLCDTLDEWKSWMEIRSRSASTIQKYLVTIKAFARHAGVMHLEVLKIVAEQISAWVNQHGPQKLTVRTTYLAIARSYFDWCIEEGYILTNPCAGVSVDMSKLIHAQKEIVKAEAFTDDEVMVLVSATSQGGDQPSTFWHHAIQIAVTTGLRLIDIANLQWPSFDTPGYLICWTQKRDKRVMVPVYEELKSMWKKNIPKTHDNWVFPSQHWTYGSVRGCSELAEEFRRICNKAGVLGKKFHGFRATFITNKVKAGVPLRIVADQAGHSYTSTTEGYVR